MADSDDRDTPSVRGGVTVGAVPGDPPDAGTADLGAAPDPGPDDAPPVGTGHVETRGRPRIRQDDEILDAALQAFATQGYDAMSLRSLNARLGLSHGTISQRFGTKEQLYFAAVDRGFVALLGDVDRRRRHLLSAVVPLDDLSDLRATIRAFLGAAEQYPELGRLMNQEGMRSTNRLAYIVDTVMLPVFGVLGELLLRLRAEGRIHPITARDLFLLVGHGAGAPYILTALSEAFDVFEGPLDPERHADDMTDVLLRGITVVAGDAPLGATAELRRHAGPPPPVGPTPLLDALHRT